ncbi:restriction endonuclease subunit S [Haemophilus haemolyticus]|uniref:Restriction endonuclease subunit S n=1 Tax=Haemophilus haemolyticus TaxID=726 RepID=A0A502LAN0_HAEHA|nr:restriction endonuclease subunit S [Haemophilus haemolyticus]TPH21130.1 restriction endonuclease subunit S [Haemophilus haemolyticus]
MSDWKEYKLHEIVEITSSKRIMRSEYQEDGIPFFRSKEIIELNSGNEITTELFISKERFLEIKNKFGTPSYGDILLTSVGTLGVPYFVNYKEEFYFKDGNLTWFRKFNNILRSKYLYYWFSSPVGRKALKEITIGSTQPALTITGLKSLTIHLPTLEEQDYIIEILDHLSSKIQLNTQINQTLEQIAQALFKSWFVDFDPVRAKVQALSDGMSLEQAELAAMQAISGKTPEELTALSQTQPDHYAELAETAKAFPCEMVEVDGVEVPKGWVVSTISECSLKIQNGGTPKRSNLEYWENGDISWLSSGEVCNNKVLVQSKEYITDLGLKGSAAKLIPPYSTLVAIYASPTAGKCAFSGFETSTNQAVCAIIPKEEYTFFNYYHLQLQEKYFANQASGSAQQNISKKIIEETPVLIPNKVILKKFNLLAKPIMNKTIENLKENNNLERKRDLLLPKLLNGEV